MGGRSPKGHPLCHTRYPTPMTPADDNTNTTPVILTAIADNRPNLLDTILTTISAAQGAAKYKPSRQPPSKPPSASPSSSASPKAARRPSEPPSSA